MGEYEKLVSRIAEYIKKEDIVETDEVISAYDLCNIISDKFSLLRNIENGEFLKRKINEENPQYINLLRKIIGVNTLLNYQCDNVELFIKDNMLKLMFRFEIGDFSIEKHVGENDLYYIPKNLKDDLLISKYYDDIMNIFNVLENFYKLFLDDKNSIKYRNVLELSYDIFDVEISYYMDGYVYSWLSLSKEVDKDKISEKEDINKFSIRTIIGVRKNQLLSKIPARKSSLPPMFKQILEEREKTFVKKRVKK